MSDSAPDDQGSDSGVSYETMNTERTRRFSERTRRFSDRWERRISVAAERTGVEAKNAFSKFIKHREVNLILAAIIIFSSLYITFVSVLDRPFLHPLDPGHGNGTNTTDGGSQVSVHDLYVNSTMSVFILWLVSLIVGAFFQFIKLPNLLGVLLTGLAFNNIPFLDDFLYIDARWSAFFRKAALTVVLIRAGIGLDPVNLRKTRWVVLRLGFVSTLCEVGSIIIITHFAFNVSLRISILFGIILGATATAVVIPTMLDLIKSGHGSHSGVPTALLASCAIDNMTCIAGYSVACALIFTTVKYTYEIAITFTTVVVSVVGGLVGGRILWVFPHEGSHHVHFIRGVLLLCVCLALNYGTLALDVPSAGVIATVLLSMTASIKWKNDTPGKYHEAESLALMWNFFAMQIMFSLIGYEFDIHMIHTNTVLKGLAVLGVCTVVRIIVAFLLSFGCELKLIEQFFMSISFLGKATLQAALAPQIIERTKDDPVMYDESIFLMVTCVMGIIIMAPICQLILTVLGPIILDRNGAPKGRVVDSTKNLANSISAISHSAIETRSSSEQRASVSLEHIEERDEDSNHS